MQDEIKMCVFSGEKRERESESEKEKKEERERKKHESQPMVFGNGHLLHSRDCENGRRDCVCVCVTLSCPLRVCGANVCQLMCAAVT